MDRRCSASRNVALMANYLTPKRFCAYLTLYLLSVWRIFYPRTWSTWLRRIWWQCNPRSTKTYKVDTCLNVKGEKTMNTVFDSDSKSLILLIISFLQLVWTTWFDQTLRVPYIHRWQISVFGRQIFAFARPRWLLHRNGIFTEPIDFPFRSDMWSM